MRRRLAHDPDNKPPAPGTPGGESALSGGYTVFMRLLESPGKQWSTSGETEHDDNTEEQAVGRRCGRGFDDRLGLRARAGLQPGHEGPVRGSGREDGAGPECGAKSSERSRTKGSERDRQGRAEIR